METQVKLTKLASCAGCGVHVGRHAALFTDPRLIVGYDKSDDACVYVVTRRPPWSKPPTSSPPLWTIPFYMGRLPRPML